MARVTIEDCLTNVANRFELVLLASKRARDISREGVDPLVPLDNDKPTVIALREIADGFIKPDYINEQKVSVSAVSTLPTIPKKALEDANDDEESLL